MTRSGEPPRTAAVTGSSTGSNGESASESTVRSACLPGTSDPIAVVDPEHARAAERGELERVGRRQRVRPALHARARPRSPRASPRTCRATASRRGCRSRSRRARRRREAPRAARRRSRGSRSSAGSARRRRRAAASSAISSASAWTQCAAIRPGPSRPCRGEQPDPGLAGRRHEELGERAPVPGSGDEPLALGGALGEVGRQGKAELGAGPVELDRAGVRRVRRDADARRGRRGSRRSARARLVEPLERRRVARRRPRGRRSRAARSRRTRSPRRPRSCSRRSS